ncbi:MAG: hypothetical protein IJO54_06915 [Oscillospiraceae bacterium]|nr:hypothetical protein [Oscillospiraceae bacterium]
MEEYKIKDTEIAASSVDSQPHHLSGDAESIQQIFDALPKLIAGKVNDFISAVAEKFNGYYTKQETIAAINNKMTAMGKGDMSTAVYDKDEDGTVDNAERLGGRLAGEYATVAHLASVRSIAVKKTDLYFDQATATLEITL